MRQCDFPVCAHHRRLGRRRRRQHTICCNPPEKPESAGMQLAILSVAVTVSLIGKPAVEVLLRHSRLGNQVMRDRFTDIREPVAELLDLDVQSGLVVTDEFSSIRVGIESAGAKECVTSNCLMAAENSRIIFRDNRAFAEVVEAQQLILAMLQYPHWWLGFPSRQHFAVTDATFALRANGLTIFDSMSGSAIMSSSVK
jgi:hypothetical protein